jgi:hypothetical protein
MRDLILPLLFVFTTGAIASAELPPPPTSWSDWSMRVTPEQPGELSAADLLDKPAGRNGPIVCRDGHFYSGKNRVRFWGVNIAFGGNFPTHEQADAVSLRFARYGINAVRFHHMDNQPFPNGIFADASLTTLSPEALDRLDYFIFALKQQGIYADLNLHVSRNYNHYHKTPDGHDGPRVDKMVDLFDPELIAAQKQYARDLLTHVNAYTHARYADEPAVGIVEINNENSLFMWNADQTLMDLSEVYAGELRRQWNRWLAAKYGSRDALAKAWNAGVEPLGESMLSNGDFKANGDFVDNSGRGWSLEQHDDARANATFGGTARVEITHVDGTAWHIQLGQPGLHLAKNQRYTVSFDASADRPVTITAGVSQAHEPWGSLGLGTDLKIDTTRQSFSLTFTATQTDDNARLSFVLGRQAGTATLSAMKLCPGGGLGLLEDENPVQDSVGTPSRKALFTAIRKDDWYTFLQQTEENYYVGMMNFLKTDIGVKCPITGTIGFGPMGTVTQSKMDFVDAHAYWQHPSFPHKQWDMSDWTIPNTAMVDNPQRAALWALAGTRVAGKPFTVTEYQHPAPNNWQAECIPMIATFAALQDWDGVFIFAYTHSEKYDSDKIDSFFNMEGNPTQMSLMPMGARIFATVQPDVETSEIAALSYKQLLAGVPQFSGNQADFLSRVAGFDPTLYLNAPMAISFDGTERRSKLNNRARWTAHGSGTGQFTFSDANGAVFVGFSGGPMPIDLADSGIKIESLDTPFATLMVMPDVLGKKISDSDKLLITAVARAQNTDMGWNAVRKSVGNQWGRAPVQIEVVQGRISIPGRWRHAAALDENGKPTSDELSEIQGERTIIRLGSSPALGYVVTR